MAYDQAIELMTTVVNAVTSPEAVSAVVGAGIAGWFGFQATKRAHAYALQKATTEEQKVTRNTLELLMVEISTALTIFEEEYASDLDQIPEGAPYICDFPIGENTFPIYDAAPSCMANFKPEVAAAIVRIYMRMKGMVAMIKMNNQETTQAHEAARMEMFKLSGISFTHSEGLYEQFVIAAANNLQMGSTADAMKALAVEIRTLHRQLSMLVYGKPCIIE